MGLLNPTYCSACGKKTNLLTRTTLADKEILCYQCSSIIPQFMRTSVIKNYTIEDFTALKEYVDYSNSALRPVFRETHSYYTIHLDVSNRLFYLGQKIDTNTIFFHLHDVEEFDLVYDAKEFHSGLLGDNVTGDILFQLKVSRPYFYYEEKLCYNVKTTASKQLFGKKVTYDNPDGMDEFHILFLETVNADIDAYIEEHYGNIDDDDDADSSYATGPSELQQAMALFMIDSLNEVTLADIRATRNRMIKTFHPDKGSADDTKYAQKINNAYEVLKEHLQ